ncbi:hypothetical protein BV25DRAFT_1454790 [Artomyces pyxidatus]|uniref:Uncharacterized protein n=1 Tax=Artomyces pyxidatus TaxID=48021 RepID=A0ACB8SLC7_9AGAM|nr:hypothetical protein BV25DRAFT_1454790 [Artomyces pyxidatus]
MARLDDSYLEISIQPRDRVNGSYDPVSKSRRDTRPPQPAINWDVSGVNMQAEREEHDDKWIDVVQRMSIASIVRTQREDTERMLDDAMGDLKATVLARVPQVVEEKIEEKELLGRNWMSAKVTSGFEELEGGLRARWEGFIAQQTGRQDAADRRLADHDRGLEDVKKRLMPVERALREGKATTDGIANRLDATERAVESKGAVMEDWLKRLELKFEERAKAQDAKIKALQESEEEQRQSLRNAKDEAAKLRRELEACRDVSDKAQSRCEELEKLVSTYKDQCARIENALKTKLEEQSARMEKERQQAEDAHREEMAGVKDRLAAAEQVLKDHFPKTQEEREKEEKEAEEKERKRRAALSMAEAWAEYEARWKNINDRQHTFKTIPWPIHPLVSRLDDITKDLVEKFVLSDQHSRGVPRKERIRKAQLRWHPDKFWAILTREMTEKDRNEVIEGVNLVAGFLNAL